MMLQRLSTADARARRRRPGVPCRVRRGARGDGRRPRRRDVAANVVERHGRRLAAAGHRVLLRRVRAAPVAADLRRRPRRARRRSLQGSERPRRADRRRRVHVSAGLLPPARLAGRLAAGSLRAARLDAGADRGARARSTASRAWSSCRSATRTVLVQVWEVQLGRVRLLLLDTDLPQNSPWDRELSARLYGGGQDTRLQQEIVLGLGGVLALRALGLQPGGVAPERRPRGVRRAAAHARLPRRRTDVGRRARRSAADDGLHDAHAGAGRTRRVSVPPGRAASLEHAGDR